MALATGGWLYRGRGIENGPVLYIVAEGATGFKDRIEAFRVKKLAGDNARPPFYLLATRLDLVDEVDQLVADIAAQFPNTSWKLIVIDTLNRTLVGSESKDEDMAAYIKAADQLRERFGGAVILIHHCGVDGSRPRGHTSLTAATDAQLAVKRNGDGVIIVTLEWMKDGPEGLELASRLVPVGIGDDTR